MLSVVAGTIAIVAVIVLIARRWRRQPVVDDTEVIRELERAEAAVRAQERLCWKPVCEDGDAGPASSKFGGRPLRINDEPWPACGNCREPMQLFVQLDSAALPVPSPFGDGVLQFFYCTNSGADCETECDAWAPRSKSTLLRVVPNAGSTHPRLPASAAFPARTIRSWVPSADYPQYEDYERLGLDVPLYLDRDLALKCPTQGGDKLLGWPAWVQSAEYPRCTRCGSEMRVIFQIDSEDHVPYMFGDVGTGHISSCPDHPSELAFGWACS